MDGSRSTKAFRTFNVDNRLRAAYYRQLDAQYREQVTGFEAESLKGKARTYHGKKDSEVLTAEELASTLSHFCGANARFVQDVAGRPILSCFGSARDGSVSTQGWKNVHGIARHAVGRDLGCSTGRWCHGYMGVYEYAWIVEKLGYDAGWAYSYTVPLQGQEHSPDKLALMPPWFAEFSSALGFEPDSEWQKFVSGCMKFERKSPPHSSFISRTLAIYFPGQCCGKIFCRPGLGTKEEKARLDLERQMVSRNLTADSWRPEGAIPWSFIMDEPRMNGGWTWDFQLQEVLMQVEEGTVHPEELEGQVTVRVLTDGMQTEPDSISEIFDVHFVTTESELEMVLERTKSIRRPFLLYFPDSNFDLAGQFVVERAYLTHRALFEGSARELMRERAVD